MPEISDLRKAEFILAHSSRGGIHHIRDGMAGGAQKQLTVDLQPRAGHEQEVGLSHKISSDLLFG